MVLLCRAPDVTRPRADPPPTPSPRQAAKELNLSSGKGLDLTLQQEDKDSAFFAARSQILQEAGSPVRGGTSGSPATVLERYIEAKYLSQGEGGKGHDLSALSTFLAGGGGNDADAAHSGGGHPPSNASAPRHNSGPLGAPWRLQCYRTRGVMSGAHLRLYFLQRPQFANPNPVAGETDINVLGDTRMLRTTTPDTLALYQRVLTDSSTRMGPAIFMQPIVDVAGGEDDDVTNNVHGSEVEGVMLAIGIQAGASHSLFAGLPAAYRWYGFFAVAKHVEVFSNGTIIFLFRLRLLDLMRGGVAGEPSPGLNSFTPMLAGRAGPPTPGPAFTLGSLDGGSAPLSPSGAVKHASNTPAPLRATSSLTTLSGALEREKEAMSSLRDRRSHYMGGSSVGPTMADRIRDLHRDVALHFCLPRTSITPLLSAGVLSAQEAAYSYCAWKFSFHFISRMSEELAGLTKLVKESAGVRTNEALALLSKLRKSVQTHSFTEAQILDAIYRFPDVVSVLFDDFAARCKPDASANGGAPESPVGTPMPRSEMVAYLKKTVKGSEDDLAVFLHGFLRMNEHVRRTNFFRAGRRGVGEERAHGITALAFRFDPSFLSPVEYPDKLFGLYMVVGAEFRAFHARFQDIARGGIRLIKPLNAVAYGASLNGLFDECYGLANTQARKNKDIVEGGSKATILLHPNHINKQVRRVTIGGVRRSVVVVPSAHPPGPPPPPTR